MDGNVFKDINPIYKNQKRQKISLQLQTQISDKNQISKKDRVKRIYSGLNIRIKNLDR